MGAIPLWIHRKRVKKKQEMYYRQQKTKANETQQQRQQNTTFDMIQPILTTKAQTRMNTKNNGTQQEANNDGTTGTQTYEKDKSRKKIVKTGPVWAAKLIELIWLNMRGAWDKRNKQLHDKESSESQSRYREEIEKKIEFLYSQKRLMSVADWHYYHDISLAERLLQSTQDLDRWYDNNVKVITYCVKEQQE